MKNLNAYDLPLRIFHWSFAFLFVVSFSIGKFVDDESLLYSYHMLSGILMGVLLVMRVFWGLLGSSTARFSSLPLSPPKLTGYFSSLLSSQTQSYLGHNPASSYAMVIMFMMTIGLLGTGLAMGITGREDPFEDIHELFAHGFLVIVVLHIAGVVFHQMRHRDGMILSMITGKKKSLAVEDEIKSNRPVMALIFVGIIILSGFILLRNFDSNTRYLSLMGTKVFLGEPEEEEHGRYKEKSKHQKNEHDNDNDDD